MKIELKPNEMVVKAGDSRYMNNDSEVSGKLILTTQRIYFKPATKPDSIHNPIEIYPNDIEDVMFFNERFFLPQGLNIITKNGGQNRFLIKKRADWSRMIVKMC